MKIKIVEKDYEGVISEKEKIREKHPKHKKPIKPNMFFRTLMRTVSIPGLHNVHFKSERIGMERLGKHEAALVLMNHSSFIDLEIVAKVMYPRPFNIVATTDGFIGKNWLMRHIGCIPTQKFVQDPTLVRDMIFAIRELKSSVVLFPEAGYSFDGRATQLPESIGRCIKMIGAPVVMITTRGAYSYDPLYNNLQHRKVDVSAIEEYLLSPEDIEKMSAEEINDIVREKFNFDSFRWQQENHIKIDAPFRADSINRILYKCPACKCEGRMEGKGTKLICHACNKVYELDEYGFINAENGESEFTHIPDWVDWERSEVRREIEEGTYSLDVPVDICVSIDTKKLYHIGKGTLSHTMDGFSLKNDQGTLAYEQRPLTSYTLNSDFNWYEIGDVIGIGNFDALYYCFPQSKGDIVAKTRLAVEEIYKILREEKLKRRTESEKSPT